MRIEVVDRGDVGMVQLRQNQSFFMEMLACRFVGESAGRKDFDGDVAGEVLVAGAIYFSHAASADLLGDAVVAQLTADKEILVWRSAGEKCSFLLTSTNHSRLLA